MIGTSALFSQKIAESSRQFRARLLYDGAAISGEIRNITINKGACGESFSIGSIYSSYIEVTLDSCEELLENKELLLQIGLVIDDTVEYIDMGHYTVSKPKTSTYSTTFTAVGRISAKLNIIPTLPEELTLSNLAAAITEATGIQIICKGVTLAGTIEEPLTGLTCREILEVITAVLGGFATEDNNGNIVISKFSTADPVSFNGDRTTTDPEFNDYDYEITGVKVIVTEEWTDEDGTVHPEVSFTDGELRQSISLKYMTESLFTAFKDNIVGYTYRPGIVPLALGDPRLEPWDCIKFTDANGQAYTVPCLNILHTFDGGLTTTITAPGESESGTAAETKGPLAQQLKGLEVTLLSIQEAIVKRLKANEILTEDIKAATGEFTKYLKGVQILAEQIDVEGLFAKDIEATGSVKGLTFISEGTPNYKDLPPEFGAWLGLSKLKADAASLIITSGTEGETDYLEAVSTAFGTKYRVYLSEGSYGGTEESILYVDGFGINFMTRQYDESEFESLFKVDFNGVSWKGSQLITRAELEKILNDLTGGGSIVLEETDPTVPAWAKSPTKPTYTADEVGARPKTWMPTASDVGARPDTWTPSANDVGADPEGTAEEKVSRHNTNTEAHNDIRLLIQGLTTRLNALADSDDTTLDQMSELVAYIKSNRELIEGVTTDKVNVTDIIDNLTTNVANKPLSAAQGVALKGLIDALQTAVNKIKVPTKVSELENDSEFLNAVPDEYVTEEELEAKGYAQQKTLEEHTSDTVTHITADERTSWNSKADGKHTHVWNDITDRPFGDFPTEEGTDTITSDDVVYGKLHRVSEFIPTYEDLQQGGSLTYYSVSDGAISGELKTITFPQGDYTIGSSNNGLMIRSDGIPMVVISFNGDPEFGAITFPDITEPGVYFDQGSYGKCIHSLTITGYDGFKFYETRTIPGKYLPDDIGAVKTVNYIAPDENGNVNVEGSGGSGAFNLIKNNTLTWNGDTEGRVVATNTIDPSMSYVRVSSVVPTLAELQNGGSYATTGADGIEYEEPFTSESIVDGDTYINCFDGYVFIAKVDSAHFVDEYIDCTMPKAGIYFAYFGAEGYTSKLAITDYTGFVKPVLKMESLTPHGHDWYGKAINKGNTIVSTNTTTQGYVKVSDLVPTEEELRKGGMVRYYNVIDGVKSEELTIGNFLESPYDIAVFDNGMTINIGFEFPVVISFDGTMPIGSISFEGITEAGVYFCQNEHTHTHSLTINEYKEFPLDVKKLPLELIPDGVGDGVSSWNDLTDKPFYETTVMGDTLTWDGNMTGKPVVSLDMGEDGVLNFCKVSEVIPTLEDMSNGIVATIPSVGTQEITTDNIVVGDGYIFASAAVIISVPNSTVNEFGLTFPETGIWLLNQSGMYISEFKINNYTGFEIVEVKPLDVKYLPESHQFYSTTIETDAITWDGNTDGLESVAGQIYRISGAIPTLEDLQNGGTYAFNQSGVENTAEFTSDSVVVIGSNIIIVADFIFIATADGAELDGMAFPKAGIYFARVDLNGDGTIDYVSSFAINNYTFVKGNIKTIDKIYLPPIEASDLDMFEERVAYSTVDVLTWDGDTTGLYSPTPDSKDGRWHISDTVPTLEQLQEGGQVTYYVPSYGISETADFIIEENGENYGNTISLKTSTGDHFAFIVPEPNTVYGSITFEKAGVYFNYIDLTDVGGIAYHTTALAINNFPGFSVAVPQPKLKKEYLPEHEHVWNDISDRPFGSTKYNYYGSAKIEDGNLVWDGVEGDVSVSFGNSTAVLITDDISLFNYDRINITFTNGENEVETQNVGASKTDANIPSTDKIKVFITVEDEMSIFVVSENNCNYLGAMTFPKKGVYVCGNSGDIFPVTISIDGYEFKEAYVESIDIKYLPESHQFGEETVTKEAITWDGNTDGLESVAGQIYRISGAIPTLEDLQNGGSVAMVTPDGEVSGVFTSENVMDGETVGMGTNLLTVQTDAGVVFIATEDGATVIDGSTSIVIDKAGIYFINTNGTYGSLFTINGYTFTETVIKTINPKYLPNDSSGDGVSATFTIETAAVGNISQATVTCDKSLESLLALSLDELYNVRILWDVAGTGFIAKPISAENMLGIVVLIGFACLTINGLRFYYIGYNADGLTITEELPAIPQATTETAGLMSAADKAKLDSLISSEGVGF